MEENKDNANAKIAKTTSHQLKILAVQSNIDKEISGSSPVRSVR